MVKPQIKFYKVSTLPAEMVKGAIYFVTTTQSIHVATSKTTADKFGIGLTEAKLDGNKLIITKYDNTSVEVDFTDFASASAMQAVLGKKLNIGAETDEAGVVSYYGLKKDIAAAVADKATNGSVDSKIAAAQAADKAAWEAYADQAEADAIAAAKVKEVDTTADKGVNLSIGTDGKLGVTVTPGSIAESDASVVTGGAVHTAIEAAKSELAGQIANKNVSAEGDALVSASATGNKVTVAATEELSGAVALAKSALQAADKTELQNGIKAAKTVVTEKDKGHVTVAKSASADGNDVYTISESDIASAQALDELSTTVAGHTATINSILGNEDGTNLNSIAELAKWINDHGAEAAKMAKSIDANAGGISALNTLVGTETVDSRIEAAKNAAIGVANAAQDDATAALGRLDVIEGSYVKSVKATGGEFITVTPVEAAKGDVTIAINEEALATKIGALETAIGEAKVAGVTKFGGKTGEITVRGGQAENGTVNLAMSDNELQASIVGLGSAAFTEASAYDAAGSAAAAQSAAEEKAAELASAALASAKTYTDEALTWAEFE